MSTRTLYSSFFKINGNNDVVCNWFDNFLDRTWIDWNFKFFWRLWERRNHIWKIKESEISCLNFKNFWCWHEVDFFDSCYCKLFCPRITFSNWKRQFSFRPRFLLLKRISFLQKACIVGLRQCVFFEKLNRLIWNENVAFKLKNAFQNVNRHILQMSRTMHRH